MLITVRVKPGSRKGPLVEVNDSGGAQLTVYVQQRAVDGQANAAVTALLASHFDVAKSRVELVRGHSGRVKTFRVEGATRGSVEG